MKLESFLELALIFLLIAVPIVVAENVNKADAPKTTILEGVSWSLDSYLGKENSTESVLPYTQITALFQSGRVSGNGGCNNYAGSYVTEGNKINFSEMLSTMMFCGDNVSSQESIYLMNLQNAATYSISNNLLKMMDAKNNTENTNGGKMEA